MSEEYIEEVLDSPLVVHKESDASYQEAAGEISMNSTHADEDGDDVPTLERHRFRKKKKNRKPLYFAVALIAVIVGIVCAIYYSGVLNNSKVADDTTSTSKSYTTQPENKFKGIITVKKSYIFFEGKEIDGIQALEREIKYLDKGTKFIIQDENADFNFLTLDGSDKVGGTILSLFAQYGIDYDITHIVSSGLMSKYETTKPETSKAETSKPKKTSNKAPSSANGE